MNLLINNKTINSFFLILFSIIPASIVLGPAISLANILLIDISFIFFLIYKKEYKFLSNSTVRLILLLYIYLIFNSFIANDFSKSAMRSFGFIRFGILFCAFNYFFYSKDFLKKVFIIWTITICIITLDVYIESFFGRNILGYGEEYGSRIVSFFKDEPIVGGYMNGFFLMIIGYLFIFFKRYRIPILIISIILLIAIFLTGERSNTIKAFMGFIIFYSLCKNFDIKEKLYFFSFTLIFIISLILNSEFLKHRYVDQIINYRNIENSKENIIKKNIKTYFKENIYFRLYKSGFSVFKNYPLFGVGNKNYQIETCTNLLTKNYYCNTHPHQTYFEFLSEHGIIGTIILLLIFYNLVFIKTKTILKSMNYLQRGCFTFLLIYFIPLLPSGAFFSDYNLTIFWLNLSLMYSVEKKLNIFS